MLEHVPGHAGMFALHVLLAVGILVNMVTAGQLLLRPPQRHAVQRLFERALLRLESHRPLDHLARLASERGQQRLLLIGLAEFLLVVAVDIAVETRDGWPITLGSFGALLGTVAIGLILLSAPVVNRLGGPALARWLVADTRPRIFAGRLALVFAVGAGALAAYQAALWGVAHLIGAGDPFDILELPLGATGPRTWAVAVGLLVAWPPFVYFWILTQVGGAALSSWLLARAGARLLRGVRIAVGRLADVNAWAGLVFAATVALGVLELTLARAR